MTSARPKSARPAAFAGAVAVLLAAAGCSQPAPGVQAASVAAPTPGAARIWFYRDFEPSISLNMAPVQLNGANAGYVRPDGIAFFRDVLPGHYHITVSSDGTDGNQDRDVDLGSGQEAYVKVLASDQWLSGAGDFSSFKRDTFFVALVPPQIARAELSSRAVESAR